MTVPFGHHTWVTQPVNPHTGQPVDLEHMWRRSVSESLGTIAGLLAKLVEQSKPVEMFVTHGVNGTVGDKAKEALVGEFAVKVGRIVHYVSQGSPFREDGTQEYQSTCRAAMITEVPWPDDLDVHDSVRLAVFNPEGLHFPNRAIPRADGAVAGSWHPACGA